MFAPSISVKPNFFTTYVSWVDSTPAPRKCSNGLVMPLSKISHGLISKKANKRIRNAIDWLLAITKEKEATNAKTNTPYFWRVNFITLTLSSKQIHTDHEIKSKLLNHFLTELRSKYGCKNYLWRAESQSNGNIHFHIITDVFIPWRHLRTDWNRIQNKLGYVDRFSEKFGHNDPNSTDVHSVQKIKNLSAYLSKYCGKNAKGYTVMVTQVAEKNPTFAPFINASHYPPKEKAKFFRQIYGNLWGLSSQLSKFKSAVDVVDSGLEEEVNWVQDNFPNKVKWFDFSRVYLISQAECIALGLKKIPKLFNEYMSKIFENRVDVPPSLVDNSNSIIEPLFFSEKVEKSNQLELVF